MSGNDTSTTSPAKTMTSAGGIWTQRGSYISNVSSKFNVGMIVADQIGTAANTTTISTNRVAMFDVYTISIPAPGAPAGFMPFFGPGHHEDDLVQRPSGLYVQRRRIAGVRSDGGRDRVLIRS
jgi:hypothetical protein